MGKVFGSQTSHTYCWYSQHMMWVAFPTDCSHFPVVRDLLGELRQSVAILPMIVSTASIYISGLYFARTSIAEAFNMKLIPNFIIRWYWNDQ